MLGDDEAPLEDVNCFGLFELLGNRLTVNVCPHFSFSSCLMAAAPVCK